MTTRTRIALGCYVVVLLALTAWGIGFMLRDEFMPYHAVAVGMPWSDVPRPFQVLILGLMKVSGALWITIGLCIAVLIAGPVRRGERWSLWAVPLLLLVECLAPVPAMVLVTANTPAQPPWISTAIQIALVLAGMALSVTERPQARGA